MVSPQKRRWVSGERADATPTLLFGYPALFESAEAKNERREKRQGIRSKGASAKVFAPPLMSSPP